METKLLIIERAMA